MGSVCLQGPTVCWHGRSDLGCRPSGSSIAQQRIDPQLHTDSSHIPHQFAQDKQLVAAICASSLRNGRHLPFLLHKPQCTQIVMISRGRRRATTIIMYLDIHKCPDCVWVTVSVNCDVSWSMLRLFHIDSSLMQTDSYIRQRKEQPAVSVEHVSRQQCKFRSQDRTLTIADDQSSTRKGWGGDCRT